MAVENVSIKEEEEEEEKSEYRGKPRLVEYIYRRAAKTGAKYIYIFTAGSKPNDLLPRIISESPSPLYFLDGFQHWIKGVVDIERAA